MDVNLLCEDLVRSMQGKVPEGVELIFDKHLPECFIMCDRNRIHQVISNFVNNAIKFTSHGSIRVGYEQLADMYPIRVSVSQKEPGYRYSIVLLS